MENNIDIELEDSSGYLINFININMKRYYDLQLKKYDITILQFGILINIYKNNVTTQKELIKYITGDEASITRLVNRLESKNLLKRVSDKDDKRKKRLELTSKGEELIQELIPIAHTGNQKLTSDLEPDEAKELLRLLQKVSITIDRETDKL